jgi:integrase
VANASDSQEDKHPPRAELPLEHLPAKPPNLKNAKGQRKHLPALPYTEVPAFMTELRAKDFISARALEFTILTAARTNEVIGAKWDEINLSETTWTVPATRMKAGVEHRVPLSERVLEILASLQREDGNPFVFIGSKSGFIGSKSGQPLHNTAMLELMRGVRPGFVPHGFRSTFRDWAAETTGFPGDILEMALAHVIKDKVEAAYRRGDLFDKRRKLMDAWAEFCAAPANIERNNVTPIRQGVVS